MARIRAALRVAFTLLALALAVTVAAPARAGSFTLRPFEGLYANLILAEVPQELYGQPIAEIRFDGNRRVESEAMNLEIDSAVGELLSARKLASDLRRLWALGKFTDVRVSGELTPAGVIVTFTVA
ncbi:MAG: hypothetical protein KC636_33505, partial [Myxococcales bacterium]|nr:hypothetical protein [Myxococcales bacterium]